jgi:hypothetical protein
MALLIDPSNSRTFYAIDTFLGAPSRFGLVTVYRMVLSLLLRTRIGVSRAHAADLVRHLAAIMMFVFSRSSVVCGMIDAELRRFEAAYNGAIDERARRAAFTDGGWEDRGRSALGFAE